MPPSDSQDHSLMCLGLKYTELVKMAIVMLWVRFDYLKRGEAPSVIPGSSSSSWSRTALVNCQADLRITVRDSPLSTSLWAPKSSSTS